MTEPPGDTETAQQALRHLRLAALIEGCTLVALVCIAVPLKHLAGIPVVSAILGPVHGIAFVAYIWLIVSTCHDLGWNRGELARLLVPAFIPFGTFFNIGFLRRKAAALPAAG
jgi:integral membrane protein